jgi:hypothetical protein
VKRAGLYAWIAILAAWWIVCVLCTHWEPVLRDGWGHVRWHLNNAQTPATIWEFARSSYLGGNPRPGQTITLLLMTDGPYHAIVTPIVELVMFYLLALLSLGRRPRFTDGNDALVFASIIAAIMLATPQSGSMMFYRPFTGNYIYGFTLNLALLVPYRLSASPRWVWAPPMVLLGAVAGCCNEHTAPAMAAITIACTIASYVRERRVPIWMVAGVLGLIAGWIFLLKAPGQDLRYAGLAQQETLTERIADRGAAADAWIVLRMFVYLAATLPWLVLGVIARWRTGGGPDARARLVPVIAGVGAMVVIGCTLLASPREGQRLYFAPCAFAATAAIAWSTAQLGARWARRAYAGVTLAALAFAAWQCLATYATLDGEYRARRAAIEAAANGDRPLALPRYSIEHDWWTIGEDFDSSSLRRFVANTWNIPAITIAPKQ